MNRNEFLERVEFLRTLLLPEWRLTVIVDATHLEEDQLALCSPDEHYEHAEIAFTRSVRKREQQCDVDQVIAHEMLHCLTREHRRVHEMLEPHISEQLSAAADVAYRAAEEKLVERVARVLSGSMAYGIKARDGIKARG